MQSAGAVVMDEGEKVRDGCFDCFLPFWPSLRRGCVCFLDSGWVSSGTREVALTADATDSVDSMGGLSEWQSKGQSPRTAETSMEPCTTASCNSKKNLF